MMKVSYLVTCSTETGTLKNLLERVIEFLGDDELIIVRDAPASEETNKIISSLIVGDKRAVVFDHSLNNDYATHKNFGNSMCGGDYIIQLDGDELPSEYIVGENLHAIVEANPTVDMIHVPRINNFTGLTKGHAPLYGWNITEMPRYGLVVNWPDWQTRIYRRSDTIKWERRLHERIVGVKEFSHLPAEPDYAIIHDKTIEKQIETNTRYFRDFTPGENHGLPRV